MSIKCQNKMHYIMPIRVITDYTIYYSPAQCTNIDINTYITSTIKEA